MQCSAGILEYGQSTIMCEFVQTLTSFRDSMYGMGSLCHPQTCRSLGRRACPMPPMTRPVVSTLRKQTAGHSYLKVSPWSSHERPLSLQCLWSKTSALILTTTPSSECFFADLSARKPLFNFWWVFYFLYNTQYIYRIFLSQKFFIQLWHTYWSHCTQWSFFQKSVGLILWSYKYVIWQEN